MSDVDTVRITAVRPWSPTQSAQHSWWVDTPDHLVDAVHGLIAMLPDETQRAQARVGLALTLRHTDDVASTPQATEGGRR